MPTSAHSHAPAIQQACARQRHVRKGHGDVCKQWQMRCDVTTSRTASQHDLAAARPGLGQAGLPLCCLAEPQPLQNRQGPLPAVLVRQHSAKLKFCPAPSAPAHQGTQGQSHPVRSIAQAHKWQAASYPDVVLGSLADVSRHIGLTGNLDGIAARADAPDHPPCRHKCACATTGIKVA